MYEQFFGLSENPFSLTPDSRFIFPSRSHDEALAHLRYWVEHREGFALITGEVGTGKTTALFRLIEGIDRHYEIAFLTNSTLGPAELLEEICRKFRIDVEKDLSKPALLSKLENYLLRLNEMGHGAILIIDEAQNFDHLLLEEVRLLSNITRSGGPPLLQIALVGQPELERKLSQPELRQLKQRIGVHYRIEPLSEEETGRYVHHRVSVAGGYPRVLFPPPSVAVLHQRTHGLPREINQVASQSLLHAYVEESASVRPDHVLSAVEEMDFRSVLDRGMTLTVAPPGRGMQPASPPATSRPTLTSPASRPTVPTTGSRPGAPPPTLAPAQPEASRPTVPTEMSRPTVPPAAGRPMGTPAPSAPGVRPGAPASATAGPGVASPPAVMASGPTPPVVSTAPTAAGNAASPARSAAFGRVPPIQVAEGGKPRTAQAFLNNPVTRRLAITGAAIVVLGIIAMITFAPSRSTRDDLAEIENDPTMPHARDRSTTILAPLVPGNRGTAPSGGPTQNGAPGDTTTSTETPAGTTTQAEAPAGTTTPAGTPGGTTAPEDSPGSTSALTGAPGGANPDGAPTDSIEHKLASGSTTAAGTAGGSTVTGEGDGTAAPGGRAVMTAYHLQVASLRDSLVADSLGRALAGLGGADFHVDRTPGKPFPWYAVYLGPYSTRADAESARVELALRDRHVEGAIVRPPTRR